MAKVRGRLFKIFATLLPFAAVISALGVAFAELFGGEAVACDTTFYYVYYATPQTDSSSAAISDLVHSYGGAGYVATVDNKCFVVVSCYYVKDDADNVVGQLNERGVSCAVCSVKVPERTLYASARRNAKKYEGNLKTLISASKACYDLANALDGLSVGQEEAKSILSEIKSVINGLSCANAGNCFEKELNYLLAECDDVAYGYVFSYNVRRLQVAVCDTVVNVNIN